MNQAQASGGPEESAAQGAGGYDSPELWGANGLIGDGRYRLTRRLGRGGMAEVFAAEDVRLGRTVAVKLLRTDLAEDPVSKARFTREAQSVAGLNHHAVVAVYDSGEDRVAGGMGGNNTVPYIVMELCEGRTIRDLLIDAEAPPVDQALIIVSGVLEALAYSHQHGIVHRDIKPANVIITDQGAVKVMDFGIARALHGASNTMTQTGMVMGTPQYLSPEQALGKAVDHRSDLYATGCLLYELLTLRPPFVGETPLSVVYQHVQDEPKVPSEVNDRVPPELDGLVLRALAKNPDDRFQTAEEMHGLVQYALRMLHEQGGWTGGMWDTGYVAHGAAATPADGTAVTSAMGHANAGRAGQTAQLGPPLLMGPPDGDGGDGYGGHGRGGGGHRGRNTVLLVLAAMLAIGLGVFIAVNAAHHGGGGNSPGVTNSPSSSDTTSPSGTPSDTSSQGGQPTDTGTGQPSDTTSTGPSTGPTRSHEPSSPPPSSPPPSSPPPSSPPPSESPSGGTTGGQSGPPTGGGTNAGGAGGAPAGASGLTGTMG